MEQEPPTSPLSVSSGKNVTISYVQISNPAIEFLEQIKKQKENVPQKLNNMFAK